MIYVVVRTGVVAWIVLVLECSSKANVLSKEVLFIAVVFPCRLPVFIVFLIAAAMEIIIITAKFIVSCNISLVLLLTDVLRRLALFGRSVRVVGWGA